MRTRGRPVRGGFRRRERAGPGHETATSTSAGTSTVPSGSRKSSVIRCAPVAARPVSGNVREWCADRFSADWHVADRTPTRVDPVGPPAGENRILRGGSYLCHSSCCTRNRVAARTSNTPDSTTGRGGFRCALRAGRGHRGRDRTGSRTGDRIGSAPT
ncbi:formylglycine-generating enzyme family protein [Streptomyces sp. NPDC051658]|uniref:formylglycine-generating enzyme family protein n=1 Tax=Streptomyces sp. NPDC051658 TaxID=3365667 RepID=UPI0037B18143